MHDAFGLSRHLQGGSLWQKDFTTHVADEVGVDPNMVGAWINKAMTPSKESDRRAVLEAVRSWFSPSRP